MIHVDFSELRKNPGAVLNRADDDQEAILVTRRGAEPVVILTKREYDSLSETRYLLSTRANAEHLFASIAEADAGILTEREPLG